MERGRFSLLDFYIRRVRRIFPALIAVLAVVWVLAWPILLWDEYQELGKHILAGTGFALNFVLYQDFNLYFGVTTTPLIHLWSLGVEEQFYIFWPLFLLAMWKAGEWRLTALLVVAAVSFLANVLSVANNPTASFYLPSSRMWELALGGILSYLHIRAPRSVEQRQYAVVTMQWPLRLNWSSPDVLGLAGATLIVLSFYGLRSTFAFPGWWALLPCLGALLIIRAGPEGWFNRHVLAHPAMIFTGLISYPLYLWHWPLLSIVHIVKGGWPMIVAAVVLAFLLAVLTYKYVELPIRTSPSRKRTASILCTAMASCALLGYVTFVGYVQARSQSYELDRFIAATREDWLSQASTDWTWFPGELLRLGTASRNVLFVGDSNMQQYYPRIAKLMSDHPSNDRSATFAVRAGCAPAVIDLVENANAILGCHAFLRKVFEYAKTPEVEAVVIGAYWRGYVTTEPTNFSTLALKPETDAALEDLRRLIAGLVSRGKHVYIVLNIPTSPFFDPRQMIRRTPLLTGFTVDIRAPSRREVENAIGPIGTKLRHIAESAGAYVIDPVDWLCDARSCPAVSARGEPMYRDAGHLKPSYVRDSVRFLDATVLAQATRQRRADVQRAPASASPLLDAHSGTRDELEDLRVSVQIGVHAESVPLAPQRDELVDDARP